MTLTDFNTPEDVTGDGMRPGPYMRLTVRDTGVGMSPEIVEKVFDPFFTTKKHTEGTGLGLFVVHRHRAAARWVHHRKERAGEGISPYALPA